MRLTAVVAVSAILMVGTATATTAQDAPGCTAGSIRFDNCSVDTSRVGDRR